MIEFKAAYSIKSFCHAYGINRSLYYKLKKDGQQPKEVHIGKKRIIIFKDAAKEWEQKMSKNGDKNGKEMV